MFSWEFVTWKAVGQMNLNRNLRPRGLAVALYPTLAAREVAPIPAPAPAGGGAPAPPAA